MDAKQPEKYLADLGVHHPEHGWSLYLDVRDFTLVMVFDDEEDDVVVEEEGYGEYRMEIGEIDAE